MIVPKSSTNSSENDTKEKEEISGCVSAITGFRLLNFLIHLSHGKHVFIRSKMGPWGIVLIVIVVLLLVEKNI